LKLAGKLAKGTRGQLPGAKPGKRGKRGMIAGGAIKTPPEKEKTLEDYGIDKSLAKEARKADDARREAEGQRNVLTLLVRALPVLPGPPTAAADHCPEPLPATAA
jgi:hypothetical protein